ncbi:MAG: RdgB/HAM1 family non-canonical purine NTP pyrophosphatase [Acidobacteriaceae bacterium]|nr:RdgB/HAM1 family non-canonical purine NTP pyrophosphatase [Acidobacteriaceae bacterium]MBV9778999.1 RdgB/HAM1 family non-canonical purine NTP pyrophosphatase [Acidobacteriaceae bacterium]
MIVYACSTNPGKLREFVLAGQESGLRELVLEPLPRLQTIPTPSEEGATFEENAFTKAVYYSRFTRELTIADDSGLEVAALREAPGVYSARYAGPNATDAANNELLLRNLQNVADRRARFVCVLALARAGHVLTTFRGVAEGRILNAPRGDCGFGYDPLFFYPPLNCTFAELTLDEKFAVSHRGNAFRKLFAYLAELHHENTAISDKIE